VSPVPSECELEPNGDDRPNPMVGFLRVYAEEEVNPLLRRSVLTLSLTQKHRTRVYVTSIY